MYTETILGLVAAGGVLTVWLSHFAACALIGRSVFKAATRVSPFETYGKKG